MARGTDISIKKARELVVKLARRHFIDEEEEQFLKFLEREGLLVSWGEKLSDCFSLCNEIATSGSKEVFQNISKQVVRQFQNVKPELRSVKCDESEANLLVIFTRAMLQEFVQKHLEQFTGIIQGISTELRSLIISRRIGKWEEINEALGLDELNRFEQDLRCESSGEIAVLPDNLGPESKQKPRKTGKISWPSKVGENLQWVAKHLEEDLKWIADQDAWVNFFDPEKESILPVVCKTFHQNNIALLIKLLHSAGKLKVKGAKGYWDHVNSRFQGETKMGWSKQWSKIACESRKDEGIFRNFLEEIEPLRNHLGIEDEDISKFLGTMEE